MIDTIISKNIEWTNRENRFSKMFLITTVDKL
jgi:hypothetical protein